MEKRGAPTGRTQRAESVSVHSFAGGIWSKYKSGKSRNMFSALRMVHAGRQPSPSIVHQRVSVQVTAPKEPAPWRNAAKPEASHGERKGEPVIVREWVRVEREKIVLRDVVHIMDAQRGLRERAVTEPVRIAGPTERAERRTDSGGPQDGKIDRQGQANERLVRSSMEQIEQLMKRNERLARTNERLIAQSKQRRTTAEQRKEPSSSDTPLPLKRSAGHEDDHIDAAQPLKASSSRIRLKPLALEHASGVAARTAQAARRPNGNGTSDRAEGTMTAPARASDSLPGRLAEAVRRRMAAETARDAAQAGTASDQAGDSRRARAVTHREGHDRTAAESLPAEAGRPADRLPEERERSAAQTPEASGPERNRRPSETRNTPQEGQGRPASEASKAAEEAVRPTQARHKAQAGRSRKAAEQPEAAEAERDRRLPEARQRLLRRTPAESGTGLEAPKGATALQRAVGTGAYGKLVLRRNMPQISAPNQTGAGWRAAFREPAEARPPWNVAPISRMAATERSAADARARDRAEGERLSADKRARGKSEEKQPQETVRARDQAGTAADGRTRAESQAGMSVASGHGHEDRAAARRPLSLRHSSLVQRFAGRNVKSGSLPGDAEQAGRGDLDGTRQENGIRSRTAKRRSAAELHHRMARRHEQPSGPAQVGAEPSKRQTEEEERRSGMPGGATHRNEAQPNSRSHSSRSDEGRMPPDSAAQLKRTQAEPHASVRSGAAGEAVSIENGGIHGSQAALDREREDGGAAGSGSGGPGLRGKADKPQGASGNAGEARPAEAALREREPQSGALLVLGNGLAIRWSRGMAERLLASGTGAAKGGFLERFIKPEARTRDGSGQAASTALSAKRFVHRRLTEEPEGFEPRGRPVQGGLNRPAGTRRASHNTEPEAASLAADRALKPGEALRKPGTESRSARLETARLVWRSVDSERRAPAAEPDVDGGDRRNAPAASGSRPSLMPAPLLGAADRPPASIPAGDDPAPASERVSAERRAPQTTTAAGGRWAPQTMIGAVRRRASIANEDRSGSASRQGARVAGGPWSERIAGRTGRLSLVQAAAGRGQRLVQRTDTAAIGRDAGRSPNVARSLPNRPTSMPVSATASLGHRRTVARAMDTDAAPEHRTAVPGADAAEGHRSMPPIADAAFGHGSISPVSASALRHRMQPSVTSSAVGQRMQPSVSNLAVAQRMQPSVTGSAVAHRMQPSVTSSAVGQRMQPSVSNLAVGQRMQPSVTGSAVGQRMQPSVSNLAVAHRMQPSVTGSAVGHRTQSPATDLASGQRVFPARAASAPERQPVSRVAASSLGHRPIQAKAASVMALRSVPQAAEAGSDLAGSSAATAMPLHYGLFGRSAAGAADEAAAYTLSSTGETAVAPAASARRAVLPGLTHQQRAKASAGPQDTRTVQVDAPREFDPDKLQQMIMKLPQLNPETIADKVYRALERKMKLEQRRRGY